MMNKKALTLPILISLVVGNMIGTGIYVLPASLAQYGTISILSWVYTSLGAIFLAITFANLSIRFPKTGGPYVYCREAYGKSIGFVVAYTYWASVMVSIAGIAVASVSYLGFMFPMLDANAPSYRPVNALLVELGIVWIFTLINIIGIHTAGVIQLFLTIIKILPLLIISLLGIWYIQPSHLLHFTTGHESTFASISNAAALTFWAFIGLESATIPAENTSGGKDIYKATIYGTILTAVVYILSTVVLMGMIPISELKNSQFPFALAGTMMFGQHAALAIAICAVVSGLGALNVCIMIQGQMVYASARDHLFPRLFTRLSKNDAPIAGQLLSSSLVSLFLVMTVQPTLLDQFNTVILLAALLTLLTYLATALSEIKFLVKDRIQSRYQTIWKSLLIALLAASYSVWMISSLPHTILLAGLILILACIALYLLLIRHLARASNS